MSKIEFMSLAEKIADGIKSGIYQDTLPSIARLSEKFDVCPATVKRVLSQLRDWDLVDGERGKCVRINPKASGNPFFHRNVVILADLPTLSCPFYAQVLNRLNESFGSVYLCFHLFVSPEQFRECGFQPDCVIVINYYSDSDMETLKRYYPSGNIIKLNHADRRYHYVASDGRMAGYEALAYLAKECGHTHIGMLATQTNYTYGCFRLRYEGAREYAMTHDKIKLTVVEIPEAQESTEASCGAMEELMRKDPRITGVFASCDVIALGVYAYAVKHSRSIPHDLAVIGFDNQDFCRTVYPQISTFSENVPETAAVLFELVKKVLVDAAMPLQHHTVSPKLLIRGSTTGKESR